jgi:accessory gene regulator B
VIKIENLANKIANKIALQLDFDDEKRAVITYGLIGILQTLTLFITITILGLIFDFIYESIIIFIGVSIIRKSAGGTHAKTMLSCNIMSVFTVLLLSALSRYIFVRPNSIYINLGFSVIIFVICFIIFYFRVPVDSPNKPITKPEKIKKLRKQSLFILSVLFMLSIAFTLLAVYNTRFSSIAVSIKLAMLWQFLTLTKVGALFIEKMDSMIYRVIENR